MPRNGSGTYAVYTPGNPVVTGTVISSTMFNNTMSDIGTALTQSIASDGQTTPTANLPMGTFRHTNVGNGVARTDYLSVAQAQDSTMQYLTGTAGTNTITASLTGLAAYATGQCYRFVAAGANTGAVTLNINSLGAKNVTKAGTNALVSGDIASGQTVEVMYDGTRFQLLNQTAAANLLGAVNISTTGGATTAMLSLSSSASPTLQTWANATPALEFVNGSSPNTNPSISSPTNAASRSLFCSNNAYFDNTNWIYNQSLPAMQYVINAATGYHQFNVAASGTGGTAITWTAALTINSAGVIYSGTQTPSAWTTYKAMEFATAGCGISGTTDELNLTANAYNASGWKYSASSKVTNRLSMDATNGIVLSTAASGTAGNAITWTDHITVKDAAGVLFKSGIPFGYGAGSGGTVTQATSRTTGVTLNKPSGQITLFSTVGSTTFSTFTVTNSTVTTSDVVVASQRSGTDLYYILVTAIGSGSFNLSCATTGGTTNEAPKIDFVVIKGATT